MENVKILEIKKDLLPYQCDIVLAKELFTLRFNYNATAGLFTVDLYKSGNLISAGEPIVYGVPLWEDVFQPDRYPHVVITPYDPSGDSSAVTYDNLGNTVLLYVQDLTTEVEANG